MGPLYWDLFTRVDMYICICIHVYVYITRIAAVVAIIIAGAVVLGVMSVVVAIVIMAMDIEKNIRKISRIRRLQKNRGIFSVGKIGVVVVRIV